MPGGGNSKPDREQDILKQVQDDINFPLKRTYLQNRIIPLTHKWIGKISSRFNLHSSLKKCAAFTLAEVLITLGIIGIVAALTLPSLISNHKKKVYVNQLKKATNTTTNGIKLILADSGVDAISNTPFYSLLLNALDNGDLSDLNTMAKRYFNLGQDIAYVPDSSRNYAAIAAPAEHTGSGGNQPQGNCILFSTTDGAELMFTKGLYYDAILLVYVDVNGYKKRPNVIGLDFFALSIKEDGSIAASFEDNAKEICLYKDSMLTSTLHVPVACYSSVVRDNWEITYY